MSGFRFKPSLALMAMIAFYLAGCGGGTQLSDRKWRDPNRTVTLAFLVPQTANQKGAALLGAALVRAAKMGISDLNDGQINLNVYDTAGDPALAAAAASQAISDGADIILGPLFGASTRAVAPIARNAGIAVLSLSSDAAVAGKSVWVTGFLPESEAARILSFARSQSYYNIGVFYPNTPYGEAALQGARTAHVRSETQLIAAATFEPGFQGVQDVAGSFAAEVYEAEAVLLAAGGTDLKSAASFLNYFDVDPALVKYLGLGLWLSDETRREITLHGGWFPAPEPSVLRAFADRYTLVYGEEPPLLAVLGYDAVQIAGQSVAAARGSGRNPFSPRVLTRRAGFEGAFGAIQLTPGGKNLRALAILEVGPTGFEVVDPAPINFGAGS